MSVLLPKKDSFPQKLVNVYHKVFPSADKRYWSTYKSKICDEIKNLSVSDLSWEIIKGRAELESKFTFIWSSVVFGVISAGIFTYGLELATKVIEFGKDYELYMLSTVYIKYCIYGFYVDDYFFYLDCVFYRMDFRYVYEYTWEEVRIVLRYIYCNVSSIDTKYKVETYDNY